MPFGNGRNRGLGWLLAVTVGNPAQRVDIVTDQSLARMRSARR